MVLAASDVSSRYSRRGPSEYEKIVDYICRVVEGKKEIIWYSVLPTSISMP